MIEELLKFESDPRIFDYKFGERDVLIWPFVRYSIFTRFISKELNNLQSNSDYVKKAITITQICNLIRSFFVFNKKNSGSDILFFYDSISNFKRDDGVYFNRLFDYYSGLLEESTVMIESCYTEYYQKPRWFKKVHYFQKDINIRKIKTRLSKVNKADSIRIELFIEYLKVNFPFAIDENDLFFIRKSLEFSSVSLKYIEKDYTKLFEKYKPKIIFIEDALYGAQNAYVTKIAKDMGIVTAEFQHGFINKQHVAYSYSDTLCNSDEYKMYTPDYLLNMGQFWSDNCKVPSEKIVIGMPHLYCNVNRFNLSLKDESKILANTKKFVLFVGGNLEKEYIYYLRNIAKKDTLGFTFILKVHPLYSKKRYIYDVLQEYSNVQIVYEGDVYNYLSQAEWVVGDISTLLYEAIAFDKKIIILENEESLFYTSREIGIWVRNPNELLSVLNENTYLKNKNKIQLWEQSWENNYISFINKTIYHSNK